VPSSKLITQPPKDNLRTDMPLSEVENNQAPFKTIMLKVLEALNIIYFKLTD
jgi:hypothetical protein